MSFRLQRVNELLKKELSELLVREIDFGTNLVTITDLETSSDLRHAKVKISVMPSIHLESVMKRLSKHLFGLQQLLNKKLKMRPVPKIRFVIDQVSLEANRVEDLLNQIKKEDKSNMAKP